jgi:orotate phosphoribosyltransferase
MASNAAGNLWLAEELWNLNAIEFGDFTLGRTAVHSPMYVNVRRLISNPRALSRCAAIIRDELETLMAMRHPHVHPFQLVAGVPFGGLHVATAYSLAVSIPMIYIHPPSAEKADTIEGLYAHNQTCLVIDDLITGGRSHREGRRHAHRPAGGRPQGAQASGYQPRQHPHARADRELPHVGRPHRREVVPESNGICGGGPHRGVAVTFPPLRAILWSDSRRARPRGGIPWTGNVRHG